MGRPVRRPSRSSESEELLVVSPGRLGIDAVSKVVLANLDVVEASLVVGVELMIEVGTTLGVLAGDSVDGEAVGAAVLEAEDGEFVKGALLLLF